MIVGLVTLYNPAENQILNLEEIQKQVDVLIVCDNSKNDHSGKMPKGCKYSSTLQNLGLSGAFNRVLMDPSFQWSPDDYIIFFDQDSKIHSNHVINLIRDYEKCNSDDILVGCIGPAFYNTSNNKVEIPHKKEKFLQGVYRVKSIITSSMLCKYKTLSEIGFWNEDVFLDMADWDLCWRMQDYGYQCLMTANVLLTHSVGLGEKKIGPFSFRVGAPIREYYQIRDCLYLLGKSYTPLKFKLRFMAMLTLRSLIHIVAFDEKQRRMYYIKRGILDFIKKKRGEFCEDDIPQVSNRGKDSWNL